MTPQELTPSPLSIPFDDLITGHLYRFTLRAWVIEAYSHICKFNGYTELFAAFVEFQVTPGQPLGLLVMLPGGKYVKLFRTQILMIELPEGGKKRQP